MAILLGILNVLLEDTVNMSEVAKCHSGDSQYSHLTTTSLSASSSSFADDDAKGERESGSRVCCYYRSTVLMIVTMIGDVKSLDWTVARWCFDGQLARGISATE